MRIPPPGTDSCRTESSVSLAHLKGSIPSQRCRHHGTPRRRPRCCWSRGYAGGRDLRTVVFGAFGGSRVHCRAACRLDPHGARLPRDRRARPGRHRPPQQRGHDRQATRWVVFYVALAALFAVGLFVFRSGTSGSEFVAGYITEYSLSVDNLFVFVIIMARFAVPRLAAGQGALHRHRGVDAAAGVFIAAGAAAIAAASWVFYIFGAFLVYTAVRLALEGENDEADFQENAAPPRRCAGSCRSPPTTTAPQLTTRIERPPDGDAAGDRDRRDRHRERGLRARLDPGDLRPDPGPLHRADRQRVRADGAAPAVLPHRRPARADHLPERRACR